MIASDDRWILIDAGLAGGAGRILEVASDLFGVVPPSAIVLTHGHFDHRGSLKALLKEWDVPVLAHKLELPYLTGRSAYPPPDPTVGGGLMSFFSFLYPKHSIDLGSRVQSLPADGSVPFCPNGKRYLYQGMLPDRSLFSKDPTTCLLPVMPL